MGTMRKITFFEFVCLPLSKPEIFAQSEKVTLHLGLWRYKKKSYAVIRRRSFREEGGGNKIHKIEEMEVYSLCYQKHTQDH